MTHDDAQFAQSAEHLVAALRRETLLARSGALADLAAAAEAKQVAFAGFRQNCAADVSHETAVVRQNALRAIADAADENTLVLDAVQATLGDILAKVRTALTEADDPGTYGPTSQRTRHVLAVRLDACA